MFHWLFVLPLLAGAPQNGAPAEADERVSRLLAELGAESLDGLLGELGAGVSDERRQAMQRLATHLSERGDFVHATPLFRDVLRMSRELFGEESGRVEDPMRELAHALQRLGRFAECAELGGELLERVRATKGDRSFETAAALVSLANAMQGLGRYEEVERVYEEALGIAFEIFGPSNDTAAVVLGNMAIFKNAGGKLSEAEALARESVAMRLDVHGPDSARTAASLEILAIVLKTRFEMAESEVHFREALRIYRKTYGPDHIMLGRVYSNLGNLAVIKGDYYAAETALRSALDIERRSYGARHNDVGWALRDLALAVDGQGRRDEALELMTEAVDISRETIGPGHPDHTVRCLDLSELLAREGQLEEAAELCLEARESHRGATGTERHYFARATGVLASILRRQGKLDEAGRELEIAMKILTEDLGEGHRELLNYHHELLLLCEERGEDERAIEAVVDAIAIAENYRTRVLGGGLERARYSGELSLGSLTAAGARMCVRSGQLERAFRLCEVGRGRALLDLLSRSERELDAGDSAGTLQALLDEEERARFAVSAAEVAAGGEEGGNGAREALRRARVAMREASAAVNASLQDSWTDARPLDTAAVRARLAPGEVILSFLWTERMAAVLVVPSAGAGEVQAVVQAEGRAAVADLDTHIRDVARRLAEDPRRREEHFGPLELADLGERLIPPSARRATESAARVVVLPEGSMNALPLDVLWPDGDGRPDLVYASSAAVYLNRTALARDKDGGEGGVLVLGDPDFPGEGEGGDVRFGALRPLPASRAEAEFVAALFDEEEQRARVLLGADATREALEAAAGGARILHLATHGEHGTVRDPYDAALALAHGEPGPDAYLTLDRLVRTWRGRLDSCDLVVLSACHTHSEVRAGSGFVSLPWGFFYAGAPTVVASLWKVDEVATALLMGRFYQNLTGPEELSKVQALREAKAWLLSASRRDVRAASKAMGLDEAAAIGGSRAAGSPEPALSAAELVPYADPYFWASFVLVGSPD